MANAATLRARLQQDRSLLATFSIVPRIEVVEALAFSGFDVVIFDLEHGPYGVETLPPLIAAAGGCGIVPVVRVPDSRPQPIGAALDVGAQGVIVPHVQSGAAARAVVGAARFAPEGTRGTSPYVRAAHYSLDEAFVTAANQRVAVLAMVEGQEGIAAIDDILDAPGLDAVFLGPVDVSMALGVPGQPEHPTVVAALERIIERAAQRGVGTAVFAPTTAAASRWLERGVRLVVVSVDTALMIRGFRGVIDELRPQ